MWTLEEGLRVVRALQNACRDYGYHLTIGGGVINKGHSEKDLDLYFLPMGSVKANPDSLVDMLTSIWGVAIPIGEDYKDAYNSIKEIHKRAIKFFRHDKRIDCFIF